jgi:hypothetical protein
MQPTPFNTFLKSIRACEEAQEWAQGKTFKEVHETCHRGDWLLWLFRRTNPDDLISITRAKSYCAQTVEHLMKDQRSKGAIQAAIKFSNGEITRDELNAAAADAAAAYAADAAAAYAAYAAAAYAAYAADAAAAFAAFAYAAAAYDAAYDAAAYDAYDAAAYDAAAAYAKAKNQMETADICRKYLPLELFNITE